MSLGRAFICLLSVLILLILLLVLSFRIHVLRFVVCAVFVIYNFFTSASVRAMGEVV